VRQTFPPPTATSEDLIRQNERLARMAANRWAMRTNQPFDELLAPAYDGLIVGCRTYDPTMLNPATGQPFALSTRVVSCINSEILHWFRDHGYSVRFPPKWKEVWGKVKRLAATNTPLEEIARQAGLKSAEEVREMLAAMVGTDRLDETHEAAASESLEVEAERLSPLQRLVREAWAGMLASDCGLLLTWWENQRRHAFPSGPIQQFHKRLKALLKGRTLRQYEQAALLTVAPSGPTRREYERQALMELFGVDEPVRVQRVRREVDGVQLVMV
jgi:DNA-binding transcriptional MerR regulator